MGNAASKSDANSVALGVGVGLTAIAAAGLATWAYNQGPAGDHKKKESEQGAAAASSAAAAAGPFSYPQKVQGGTMRQVCEGDSCRLVWEPEPEPEQQRRGLQEPEEVVRDGEGYNAPKNQPPMSAEEHKAAARALQGEVVKISMPESPDGGPQELFDAYVVGTPKDGRCVLVAHDIYGFMSGRIPAFCDDLAAQGYLVIHPNFFGDKKWSQKVQDIPGFFRQFSFFEPGLADILHSTMEFAWSMGAEHGHFGMVGFSWGSYMVMHASASGQLAAGVQLHPSHIGVMGFLDEDPVELTHQLQCPQLLYTASSDPEALKPAGEQAKIVERQFPEENDIREFPDMHHGWVSRGDPEKHRVHEAQQGVFKFLHRLL